MSDSTMGSAVIEGAAGFHARPAVKVSKLAKKFNANVELSVSNGERWINAKSTNAVMKMKATTGTQLLIRAEGVDADTAVSNMVTLIRQNFEDA